MFFAFQIIEASNHLQTDTITKFWNNPMKNYLNLFQKNLHAFSWKRRKPIVWNLHSVKKKFSTSC